MMLGEPHYVETDSFRTSGGEEDSWAFSLSSGQRMAILLQVPYEVAIIYGDPPALLPILGELGLSSDDVRLHPFPVPFEHK